jgi:Zn-dependent membrane protease YugP
MFMSLDNFLLYLLFSLPALILGLWAQTRVHSTYTKFSQVRLGSGRTGAQIARRMLDVHGLHHIGVEQVDGLLTDHYDPVRKVLRLSSQNFQGTSLAAASIAAHEAGHALQHQEGYAPLVLRSAMVPIVQFGSWLGPIIFLVGFLMAGLIGHTVAWIGVLLFAGVAVFALITLPVEFDASRRAKALLTSYGLILPQEAPNVGTVLNAAALTYVAAATQAISTMLYYGFLLVGVRQDE